LRTPTRAAVSCCCPIARRTRGSQRGARSAARQIGPHNQCVHDGASCCIALNITCIFFKFNQTMEDDQLPLQLLDLRVQSLNLAILGVVLGRGSRTLRTQTLGA